MEHAISILLFLFAGLLLLYAGLIAATKSTDLIPRDYAAKMEDKKRYAVQFAKVLAAVSLAPAIGGAAGLILGNGAAAVVTLAAFVLILWRASRWMDGEKRKASEKSLDKPGFPWYTRKAALNGSRSQSPGTAPPTASPY